MFSSDHNRKNRLSLSLACRYLAAVILSLLLELTLSLANLLSHFSAAQLSGLVLRYFLAFLLVLAYFLGYSGAFA